jgi:hypothetical protein
MEKSTQYRSSQSAGGEPGKGGQRQRRALPRMRGMIAPLVAVLFAFLMSLLVISPGQAAARTGRQLRDGAHSELVLQAHLAYMTRGQDVGRTVQHTQAPPPPSDPGGNKINTALTNIGTFLTVFVGGVTLIMLIIGGYLMQTSEGNVRRRELAYGTLAGAVVGLIIVLLASDITKSLIHAIP